MRVLPPRSGISDFEALCSRKHDAEVQLYAFYVFALDGEDLRRLPLSMPKTNLDRLSARRPEGIFVAPFEQGEIGPDLFRAACKMGLEGLVSKRRDPRLSWRPMHALDQGQELGDSRNRASGGLISVEHPLDLLGVGRLGQRQHQQDTCLLRVKRI